ncbi:F-box protein [Corchorus olitorius]|uniref:F-box protein n=1 Tax=Corchorus olitorius TaxID=93759 RepID=A0A1R3L263_9ROSI|nr:F-box protein [Corchorus olitorius]
MAKKKRFVRNSSMAATKKSKTGVYFPADLVNEILLKLPIKSIVRFNCVAKNCYKLLWSSCGSI